MNKHHPPVTSTRAKLHGIAGLVTMLLCLGASQLLAATSIIYSNNFESYSSVATNLSDAANANPTGNEWNIVMATAIMAMIPPAIVVIFMQRWFVKGLVDTEK